MNERLAPQEYIAELKKLRESIMATTSRARALDEEEKPMVLARARVGGIELDLLVSFLEQAEDRAVEAVRKAELFLAAEGHH
jgi:hypothetical protein